MSVRLLTVNKILLGAVVVVVPLSIYGGIRIKERSLARELDQLDETNTEVQHEAKRARIAQLENERKELLAEGRDLDMKIQEVRSRMRA